MAADARFQLIQADLGAFAQPTEKVVGSLRVVNGARHGLKAEQADGLLVELVHGGAAKIAGRLKQCCGGKANRGSLLHALKQKSQGKRRRVRGNHRGGKKVCRDSHGAVHVGTEPGSADQHARLAVQRAGQVEHRGTGAQGLAPILPGQVFGARKKGEVDALEGVGFNSLDDGDFVPNLVKLALGCLVVKQHKVGPRKGRVGQRILQLPAQQG